ncbi:MAG: hypothetical protein EZS28_024078, partial [Streblomastix strix]
MYSGCQQQTSQNIRQSPSPQISPHPMSQLMSQFHMSSQNEQHFIAPFGHMNIKHISPDQHTAPLSSQIRLYSGNQQVHSSPYKTRVRSPSSPKRQQSPSIIYSKIPQMSKEEEIKRHFICELTNKIMTDPVSIDGPHYFERDALMDYIKDTGMTPVTKQKISTDDITEEPELKDKIQSLVFERQSLKKAKEVIMTNISERNEERKDRFYLETLALPGEIQSMVVGRFFDRNIESLILAKSTFLSVFHNNDLEDSFDFVDHICVYKEIYCLCVSVQPHNLDCLFVLSIGGEWLLLQWNKTRFFPLASGSLLKAIQPLMKTPEQRRFRLDPTFQWAVSVVPITDNSPRFFTRPTPILGSEYTSGATKPIIRISFRALIVVDETVFVGVKYDGPDANFLQVIKDNWSVTLQHFPKKFGFFDPDNKYGYKEENINTTIRNGLETEWKALFTVDHVKKNICIAKADTFLFFENDKDRPNFNELKKKKKVRHLVFTTSMRLEPFPIKK